MQSVTVNGQPWQDFDAAAEWVRVPKPTSERYEIVVRYWPFSRSPAAARISPPRPGGSRDRMFAPAGIDV